MDHTNGGRVAVVLGTRPEVVKLAEVVHQLGPLAWVLHTGQHWDPELHHDVHDQLGMPRPDVQLGVGGGSRAAQLASAVSALDELFAQHRPAAVLVQGDTTSTLAGALAGNTHDVPIVHLEAGLRSYDRAMPEEHNRVLTDHLAERCLAPTTTSSDNLRAEGIDGARVAVIGNTVVGAVARLLPGPDQRAALARRFGVRSDRFVLATFHRPENVDDPAILALVLDELHRLRLPVVLPLHPRTRARIEAFGLTGALDRVQATPPLGYREFLGLAAECALLVSDSGGVQEEASVVKRPVVVVRRSTERPEVLDTFARLVSPGEGVRVAAADWLDDVASTRLHLAGLACPYGDEHAARRCTDAVLDLVGPEADSRTSPPPLGAQR